MSQANIKLAHQCSNDDLFETVTERDQAEVLLRGYRGDAVGMQRLREILSAIDRNVFHYDDHKVLAVAAGKLVKGELRVKKDPCERKSEENRKYLDWILVYRSEAQDLASTLRTTVQNILGLAAIETEFGTNRFATDAYNFFALTATKQKPLPGQIGLLITGADPNLGMAKFRGFETCAKAFAQTTGQTIKGETDPARFATILYGQGNFGIGPHGPIPAYVKQLTAIIHEVAIRLKC